MRLEVQTLNIIAAFVVALTSLISRAQAQTKEVEKHLRHEYRDRTLVLRGFYAGDRLHYDSAGVATADASSKDWIADGFVRVRDLQFSHHRLTIKAERLLITQLDGGQFQFLPEDKEEKRKLEIEADLDPDHLSSEQADAALARIFLTSHDDLSASVSDYWKPCVRAAAVGNDKTFSFSAELLTVPGVAAAGANIPAATSEDRGFDCSARRTHYERGVHPTLIYQANPEFSEQARRAKFQGVVTLRLVVNEQGLPEDIRVTKPLGMGLDEKAMSCLEKWRFKPAEKDGQPVAMEIAVQIDFHLY